MRTDDNNGHIHTCTSVVLANEFSFSLTVYYNYESQILKIIVTVLFKQSLSSGIIY